MSKAEKELLLLSCCGPCSCGVIKTLAEKGVRFSVFFFNPNISSLEEYEKRRDENKRVCETYDVPFIEGDYSPKAWFEKVKGFEDEPERGKRCSLCFEMRLRQAALYAKEHGFQKFSSVLGISRYKDLNQVNAEALNVSKECEISYDFTNWRKGGIQELTHALIQELSLYNQTYCGCVFSKKS